MGCHSWTYKKVSSFSKDDLVKEIRDKLNSEFMAYVYSTSREKYAQSLFEMNNDDKEHCPQYWDKDRQNVEDWGKVWDEYQDRKKSALKELEYFAKSDNENFRQEFIDFILKYQLESCYLVEYKGEYYIFIGFDRGFRCHVFYDDFFDNYDDLIDYLSKCPENMVVQYTKDYDKIPGLTEELKTYLKDLYKNNDVIVEFG